MVTQETEKDIARLEKGEHIDYVIGWVDFAGCRIDLSKRPLIPRPETEFWVDKAIRDIKRSHYTFSSRFTPSAAWGPTRLGRKHSARASLVRFLDLFAGSGCIGVAVLKHIPWAKVDFGEKEKKLLNQIIINTKLNGISPKRYQIFQSDIFSNIKEKYDYILPILRMWQRRERPRCKNQCWSKNRRALFSEAKMGYTIYESF